MILNETNLVKLLNGTKKKKRRNLDNAEKNFYEEEFLSEKSQQ